MYCEKCGAKLSDNENFCQYCGNRVSDADVKISPRDNATPEMAINKNEPKSNVQFDFQIGCGSPQAHAKKSNIFCLVLSYLIFFVTVVGVLNDFITYHSLGGNGVMAWGYTFNFERSYYVWLSVALGLVWRLIVCFYLTFWYNKVDLSKAFAVNFGVSILFVIVSIVGRVYTTIEYSAGSTMDAIIRSWPFILTALISFLTAISFLKKRYNNFFFYLSMSLNLLIAINRLTDELHTIL